jgi:type I restriction enzyme R subunit
LRIATIFTYGANEEDEDAQDYLPGDEEEWILMAADSAFAYPSSHTRDKLESFIVDYNKMYGTSFTTKDSQGF